MVTAAANTWGLILLVCCFIPQAHPPDLKCVQGLMIGYGIVDVPRSLWRIRSRAKAMRTLEVVFYVCVETAHRMTLLADQALQAEFRDQ